MLVPRIVNFLRCPRIDSLFKFETAKMTNGRIKFLCVDVVDTETKSTKLMEINSELHKTDCDFATASLK